MALVDARVGRQRVARVQVERHVERRDRRPERPVSLKVVIDRPVDALDFGKAVHQGALEAQLPHAALQLAGSHVRILHGQRGQRLEPVRPLGDLLGQEIVRAARQAGRLGRVRDRLHRRGIERQQHHGDAVVIHLLQPGAMDVEQPVTQLVPHALVHESERLAHGFFEREVLFKYDLAIHDQSPLADVRIAA